MAANTHATPETADRTPDADPKAAGGRGPEATESGGSTDAAMLGAVVAPAGSRGRHLPGPRGVLALQRRAGNAATTELLLRRRRAGARVTDRALQRITDEQLNAKARDPDEAFWTEHDQKKGDAEKDAHLMASLGSVRPATVEKVWLGLSDELAAAKANPDAFAKSVAVNDNLPDHDCFDALKEQFKKDVERTALNYLAENRAAVQKEMKDTGVTTEGGEEPNADQNVAVQDIQKVAPMMEKVVEAKKAIQQTPVGMMQAGQGGTVTLKFDPGGPPPTGPNYYIPEGFAKWEDVNANWRKTLAIEAALIQQNPSAAYFMGEGGAGDLAKLKDPGDVTAARAAIGKGLNDLAGKIDKAVPLIGDDLTYIDFPPIHQQLLGGQLGPSGTLWSGPVEKAVAKELISDATLTHLLASLGIGLASGALFLFASIATAGGAAVLGGVLAGLGVVASGAQAASSWDKYHDLATAQAATVDPEMALVTADQVDSAMLSAVLDTVFAFLDAYQAVKGAYVGLKGGKAVLEAGKVGIESSSRVGLRNLAKAADKRLVLEQAIKELGHEEASKIAGISYEEMAGILGKESELGKRLLVLGKVGLTAEMGELLKKLPQLATLGADEGEKVLAASIETYGMIGTLKKTGGWAAIKKSAAMESAAGKAMEAWRHSLVEELQQFIAKESKDMTEGTAKAIRTGTEQAASDVDVQVIGGAAAELQQRAEGWLAGRLDTGVAKAKGLLDAEIFVDPLRSHIIDVLKEVDDATKQLITRRMADKEKAMIFGARLREAGGESTEAGKKIIEEADAAKITIQKDFEPMSAAAQKRASQIIDGKMGELKAAADPAKKAAIAEEIAELQARINASHPDAYVGGGVKIWVSGREEDIAKIAEASGVPLEQLKAATNAQRVTAALTEAKWLEAAVKKLAKPVSPADAEGIGKLAKTVTDVGKHGARAAEQLGKAGAENSGALKALMDELKAIKATKAEAIAERIKNGDIDLIRGQIDGHLENLRTQTALAVKSLGDDARTLGVDLAKMAEYQRLVDWQIFYATMVDAGKGATAAYCELLKAWVQSELQQSISPPAESLGYTPDPNAVFGPPPEPAPAAP
jgi:hypothetical protein